MPKRKSKGKKSYIHVSTRDAVVPTHLFLTTKEYSKLSKKAGKRFQKWRYE